MKIVRNIIFDLGGVLLDIDFKKTSAAFEKLGISKFDNYYSQHSANELFEKLETGQITAQYFYDAIKQHCQADTTDQQVQVAWNALLLHFRKESINALLELKNRYDIYLLSNTNGIHQKSFEKTYQQETGLLSLDHCFKKSYYSHIIHMRKPYRSTYDFVLKDAGLLAEETLFIDDSYGNISGAIAAGLHTHLLLPEEKIENLDL